MTTKFKSKLINTQNDLPETVRQPAVELLNEHLADVLDLALQAKQAHWNVKGPGFIALHKLFDEAAEQLREYADEIAERSVQLGGMALGTVRIAAERSRLPDYPLEITSGREHASALSRGLAEFARSVRAATDAAAELGDADTTDVFTQVSRGIDKLLWKVEAQTQAND